jgi:hypothetical protein
LSPGDEALPGRSALPGGAPGTSLTPRGAPLHALPPGLGRPAYGGACLDGLSHALLAPGGARPDWLPPALRTARQVVLLLVDGLGWEQLQERLLLAPYLASMQGGPISSVAPTTTASALTSLTVGLAPAEHGIVGYKFAVQGPTGTEVLNVLRWATPSGDARRFFPPGDAQPRPPFGGASVPVVSRSDFSGTGFSEAHQRGVRESPWVVPSSLLPLVKKLLDDGEPFVYAYYDGIDKVAHATGLGPLYGSELRTVDRMVGELAAALPPGAALAVTADHGQVEVGPAASVLQAEVLSAAVLVSGEARFRWLHSPPGGVRALAARAQAVYGAEAWVATRDEVEASGVLGPRLAPRARERLGDVVVVPYGNQAYLGPQDGGEAKLVCRHGGLSREELLVPLLCAAG